MAKEEKPVTSKHKVVLEFWRWNTSGEDKEKQPEKRPLELASTQGELHTGFSLTGTVDLEKNELYDVLRGENEEDKFPLFLLRLQ